MPIVFNNFPKLELSLFIRMAGGFINQARDKPMSFGIDRNDASAERLFSFKRRNLGRLPSGDVENKLSVAKKVQRSRGIFLPSDTTRV